MIKVMQRLFGGVVNEQNYAEFLKELGKKFIPKAEYNARLGELKELREQALQASVAAEDLQSAKAQAEDLTREVAALQERILAENAAHKEIVERLGRENVAEVALVKAGAKNLAAAKAVLDLGEGAAPIEEQVAELLAAEETAFLFEKYEVPMATDWVGFVPQEAGDLPEEGYAGAFKLRLAKAHGAADCFSAIKVKQEAAARGVIL